MRSPKVSIIIPNYNYQEYVLNTVETCLAQDYRGAMEVIVVDDASRDSSVFKLKKEFFRQIRIIELNKNVGYSAAKNEGIRYSTGDLIVTLDADDMLTKDSIRVRVEPFVQYPKLLMVHALAWVIKGDGDYNYWNKRLYKLNCFSKSNKIHAQTVMLRRQVHIDYGLYDEQLRSRSDNEMWHRLIDVARIGCQIKFLEVPVAFYRKHEKSMVEFRKKNPPYNVSQTSILENQKALRLKNGINKENTRFLKK